MADLAASAAQSNLGRRLPYAATALVVAALVLPGTAVAHVGTSAPVATNFVAQISGLEPASAAVRAKAVDGDREIWLQARADTTVLVLGAQGEPLLRFDRGEVLVNVRSLTAQADGIDRFDLRPDPNPHAQPLWHRVRAGRSYLWHEHRLHALEPLGRDHQTTAVIGHWAIPLVIDGRRHVLAGALVYHPSGSPWPWILLACVLAAASAVVLAASSVAARRVAVGAALVAALLVWMVRVGRELYGRPTIGVTGYVEAVLTSLVGLLLLRALVHRDEEVRLFTAFLVGLGCVYQALTMLPVFTHALALTTLPTPVARASVAAILGLGSGVIAITMRALVAQTAAERAADALAL